MEFTVNSGVWGTMFGVPCIVADNFLKLASEEQIKVLIYILRHSGKISSDVEIALNTGVSADKISDALLFWQQANVISPQQGAGTASAASPSIMQPAHSETPLLTDKSEVSAVSYSPEAKRPNHSGSEIAEIMKGSEDISELFKISESMLGTLRNNQMNSLIWIYDYLGLKKEVIVTLIAYCIKIDKTNPAYIEKIACSWAENDINTLSSAQEEVQRLTSSHDFADRIVKLFEMNRKPSSREREVIEQWQKAGYSSELMHYAYEKTIEQINKLSFAYINKILISWRESGFNTVKKIKEAEEAYRSGKDKHTSSPADPELEKYKQFINKF